MKKQVMTVALALLTAGMCRLYMITSADIRRILTSRQHIEPSDDFRIIDSWTEYSGSGDKPVAEQTVMRSFDFNGKKLILQCARQKDGVLQVYDFIFSNNIIRTKYKDKSGNAKESRIYFGKVYIFDDPLKKTTTGKTYFSCSVGLRTFNGEEKSMDFVSLKFWDNDTERLAAKASKLLKDKALYAIGISEIEEYTKKDGDVGFSASGLSIYDLNDGLEEEDSSDSADTGADVSSELEDAFIGGDTATVIMSVKKPEMVTAGSSGSDPNDDYPF